jgi:hypothetical protein
LQNTVKQKDSAECPCQDEISLGPLQPSPKLPHSTGSHHGKPNPADTDAAGPEPTTRRLQRHHHKADSG